MIVFLLILGVCFGVAVIYVLTKLPKILHAEEEGLAEIEFADKRDEVRLDEAKSNLDGYRYSAVLIALLGILAMIYFTIAGTPYEGHFREWSNLIVRLLHITFGIAWIGASFYFVFLENSLNRTKGVRDELAGNLWAVHGGGFYFLEKYKVAPAKIPNDLHWFKYEAYFTWLSGFSLLCVVYYFNAKGLLIDPNVMDISPIVAISIGVGSFILGWIIYAYLSRTKIATNGILFAIIGFGLLAFFAWFYCQVFSARAAYIHFGALIGTLMVGNVYFIIIPAQKAMVEAAKQGLPLDPELGKHAGWRSLHNNYLTLPVLFVMISNHFPSTFSNENNWLVLMAITIGTAGIKHYLNLMDKKQTSTYVLPVSVFLLIAVVFVTAPIIPDGECNDEVLFTQIYPIFQERCVTCHSAQPTDPIWTAAPNGVMYDTPQQIADKAELIMQRVVITKTMPQNNQTGMLPEERELVRCWIEQGAKTEVPQ